jgi:hypothetical protein
MQRIQARRGGRVVKHVSLPSELYSNPSVFISNGKALVNHMSNKPHGNLRMPYPPDVTRGRPRKKCIVEYICEIMRDNFGSTVIDDALVWTFAPKVDIMFTWIRYSEFRIRNKEYADNILRSSTHSAE